MNQLNKITDAISVMKSDSVANYVIAGLDSHLLNNGTVRVFTNNRAHQDSITPHSHRYDLTCLVLKGGVTNITWLENESSGDEFRVSRLKWESGVIGDHEYTPSKKQFFSPHSKTYAPGDVYHIPLGEIHSIRFDKDTKVLLFEGPSLTEYSLIIEPVVRGKVIPTYKTEDYMFNPIGEPHRA